MNRKFYFMLIAISFIAIAIILIAATISNQNDLKEELTMKFENCTRCYNVAIGEESGMYLINESYVIDLRCKSIFHKSKEKGNEYIELAKETCIKFQELTMDKINGIKQKDGE